jgi:hypothetical protein
VAAVQGPAVSTFIAYRLTGKIDKVAVEIK